MVDILSPKVRIPFLTASQPVRQKSDATTIETYNPDAIVWTNIPLGTGWSNVGGSYSTARYRLLPGGRVTLTGYIQKATLLSLGETILTMPAGFRPAQTRVFGLTSILSNSSVTLQPFELRSTGELVAGASIALSAKISLEQIEYDAEG